MGNKKRTQHVAVSQPFATPVNPEDPLEQELVVEEMDDYSKMSHLEAKGIGKYPTAQQNEFMLVNSMYSAAGDDFERIEGKKSPWRHFENLAFAFNVTSIYNLDFMARLEFELPLEYPKVALEARLLRLRPLQDDILEEKIRDAVKTIPQQQRLSVKDVEMEGVMPVVETVVSLLDDAAKVYESRLKGKSLAEVRDQDNALLKYHKIAEREQMLARKEADAVAHEENLKKSLLLEKKRRHDPNDPDLMAEEDPNEERYLADIPVRFKDRTIVTVPYSKEKLSFHAVVSTMVLLKRPDKTVTLVFPLKFGKLYGCAFLLKQIYIPAKIADQERLGNAMDEIRKTLEDCKTSGNPNIVKVYAYQIDLDDETPDMIEWNISILSEYSVTGPLTRAMDCSGASFAPQNVRKYGNELLQALDFVERMGHTHPALHCDNILFFNDPLGGQRVKLSDGYGTTLRALATEAQYKALDAAPAPNTSGWTPPEIINSPLARTNKTCIWELAMVIINMGFLEGYNLEHVLTSPDKLTSRDDLEKGFIDFISIAFQTMPKKRLSASQLMTLPFFKDGKKAINIPTPENPGPIPHLLRSGYSAEVRGSTWGTKWMKSDKILGQGGFGRVVRARNVDDNQFYAVKEVKCESKRASDEIWAEVRLLAQLNHPNVVRYYNAWNEAIFDEDEYLKNRQAAIAQVNQPRAMRVNEPPSTEHEFEDPSIQRHIGPEYSTEDEDSNPFGYQSAGGDSDDDAELSEGIQSEVIEEYELQQPSGINSDDNNLIQFGSDDPSGDLFSQSPEKSTDQRAVESKIVPEESILYIQMELCDTETLSSKIKSGLPYRPQEVWQMFRQILEGLEHIHSHGVVHRDLKPANIFIYSNENIKIGDFGLAITGRGNTLENNPTVATSNLKAGYSSRGVGTKYYTAPELEVNGSGEYSTKADMFSLGVIFFQMCLPINTEAEKLGYLRQISENTDFRLPKLFEQEEYQRQAKIISRLINHNQDDRPSAREILQGDYLPEIVGTNTLQRYIHHLAQDPVQWQGLVDRMFTETRAYTRAQELAHFSKFAAKKASKPSVRVIDLVNEKIRTIFEHHGAVSSDRMIPFPAREFYIDAAILLHEDGLPVQLPSDLTLPFAIMLANPEDNDLADEGERPPFSKYYCFGSVFRKSANGSQSVSIPEIDYDCISFSAKDLSLKDAHVIKVLDHVITEQPAFNNRQLTIFLNHGDLLDLILEFCKIPDDRRDDVKRELSHLHVSNTGWSDVRAKLLRAKFGLSESAVSALAAFKESGSLDKIIQDLNRAFDDEYASRAVRPLMRLADIIKYTELMGAVTPIIISPLSNQSEPLYSGSIMFQCVLMRARQIVAVGGRYDKLVEHYEQPDQPKRLTRATGFRMNSRLLYDYAQTFYSKRSSTSKSAVRELGTCVPPRVNVVVTSFDEGTLQGPCMTITYDLVANGISAETSEHFNSMEDLDHAYGEPLDYWLVIVRPGSSTKRAVKVRSPTREETEVRASELAAFIKAGLGSKSVAQAPEAKLRRTTSTAGESHSQVILVAPKHKGKKSNRMNVTDAAAAAAAKLTDDVGSSPVVVFAPSSDGVLQQMRNTRLADGESWRTLRQAVEPAERAYLQEVQKELESLAEQGKEGAFVVNQLTNSCIFYDLGKRV